MIKMKDMANEVDMINLKETFTRENNQAKEAASWLKSNLEEVREVVMDQRE